MAAIDIEEDELPRNDLTAQTGSDGLIGGRFSVNFAAPLKQFDTEGAKAYEVVAEKGDLVGSAYALVSKTHTPWRLEAMLALSKKRCSRVLSPITGGKIVGRKGAVQQVVIMPRPEGGLVFEEGHHPDWSEAYLRKSIIPQLAEILDELKSVGITHRHIHTGNVFWKDKGKTKIILGDCFTAPAGQGHPPIFESLHRASCHPEAARGEGSLSDDVFALGVVLAKTMSGRATDLSDETHSGTERRFMHGSSSLLMEGLSVSTGIQQIMKGLLDDDQILRWNADDIRLWMRGTDPPPRQTPLSERLRRPLVFNGQRLTNRRLISFLMGRDSNASMDMIRSDEFSIWIQTALSDGAALSSLRNVLQILQNNKKVTDDLLLLKVRRAFDTYCTANIGDMEVCADGFGAAVAQAYIMGDGGQIQFLKDALQNEVVQQMFTEDIAHGFIGRNALQTLIRMRAFSNDSDLGSGMHRVAYEMNPDLHCLSPKVLASRVSDVGEIMFALEKWYGNNPDDLPIFDRHLAAYISARRKTTDSERDKLAAAQTPNQLAMANLEVAAKLQRVYYRVGLKNIASAIATSIEPYIKELFGQRRRKAAERRLEALVEAGNLNSILRELDIPRLKKADASDFKSAVAVYAQNSIYIRDLSKPVTPKDMFSQFYGQRAAALLAYLILTIMIVILFMMNAF